MYKLIFSAGNECSQILIGVCVCVLLQLKVRVNEVDDKGDVPLDLALQSMQEAVAETLLSNLADVNWKDEFGNCLLHKAIKRGNSLKILHVIVWVIPTFW